MSENLPTWNGPELDTLAEAAAREWYDTGAQVLGIHGQPYDATRDWMKNDQIKVFKTLFADLRRPASRDLAARVLAERVCLKPGATAPMFRPTTGSLGGWVLSVGQRPRDSHEFAALEPSAKPRGNLPQTGLTVVPDLTHATDPAWALALCLENTRHPK